MVYFESLVFRLACSAEPPRHLYEIGEGSRLHLSHHAPAVRLHGDLADSELHAHLLVGEARDDEIHDFSFAFAQCCAPPLEQAKFGFTLAGDTASLERAANGVEQD